MNEIFNIKGKIPSNIDLDEVLSGVEGNITRIRYIREGMIYFLTLLSIDNYHKYKSKDSYISLNDKILSEIIGKGGKTSRTSEIKRILIEHSVIETRTHRKGFRSRGYRLTEKYNTGLYRTYDYSDRIKNKLELFNQSRVENEKISRIRYAHIYNQFERKNLTVDLINAENYLKNISNKLFEKINNSKRFQELNMKSLFNYIGSAVCILSDIKNKNYFLSTSESNKRFYSNLTSLPKYLRPFLKINDERIGEVDLSSSQTYILSTILNDNFLISENEGYNLRTIYSELKDVLNNCVCSTPSNQVGNNNYILGVYMNDENFIGLERFVNIDFTQDFYNHLIKEGDKLYPNFKKDRKFFKKQVMNFLFEDNDLYRWDSKGIKFLKLVYPELCEFIERFNQSYLNNEFACLLQRTESYLMLDCVCKKIDQDHPQITFFTIHDSIITAQPNVKLVNDIIYDTITEITSKPLGLKHQNLEPITELNDYQIEDTWKKIKITSEKNYDKKKSYINHKNIKLGIDLVISEESRMTMYKKLRIGL